MLCRKRIESERETSESKTGLQTTHRQIDLFLLIYISCVPAGGLCDVGGGNNLVEECLNCVRDALRVREASRSFPQKLLCDAKDEFARLQPWAVRWCVDETHPCKVADSVSSMFYPSMLGERGGRAQIGTRSSPRA